MSNYKLSADYVCPIDRTRTYRTRNQVIKLKRIDGSWCMFERGPDGALRQQPHRFRNLHNAERWMFENTHAS